MNNHLVRALTSKSFLFLWLAEVLSQIAGSMTNFILILVVYALTNSNTAVAGIVLSFTVPAIVFGVVAGVFVDRWDKKYVLFGTNIIRAIAALLLSFFHQNLIFIYLFSFIITVATQFFIPAETSIIPNIVEKKFLLSANALFGIALYGSLLIAYALSGPFLLMLGRRNIFIILAIVFSLAAISTLFVKTKQTENNKKIIKDISTTVTSEIKTAFSLIVKIKEIYHSFLLLTLSQTLILVISVIGPGYAKHVLNIRIADFPLLFVTPAAIGMVSGAVLLTNHYHHASKQKSATLGLFISAIALCLLPFGSKVASRPFVHTLNIFLPHLLRINILHIMVFLAFVMGLANALIFVPSNTIIQENSSEQSRGKVYGALNAMVALFSLFPVILAGSIADKFGVNAVLITMGIIMMSIGIFRVVSARFE